VRVIEQALDVAAVESPEIRDLIAARIAALIEDEPYHADMHGRFVVWDTGDTIDDLSRVLSFSALSNRFTGVNFGELGFTPSFELVEEHPTCFEMVFVLSDDGYGVIAFIPKSLDADATLLAMCRQYAIPVQESTSP
jgi:hypothetical protein